MGKYLSWARLVGTPDRSQKLDGTPTALHTWSFSFHHSVLDNL